LSTKVITGRVKCLSMVGVRLILKEDDGQAGMAGLKM
jgi:hypothetical protein